MKAVIPEVNYAKLASKIAKLNKKAAKLGTPEITMTVLAERFEIWHKTDATGHSIEVPVKVFDVEVVGEAPVLNGWKLAAKLEHTPNGNVMYSLLETDLPAKFRTVDPWCEHCKTNRERNYTYVVTSEAGEFVQVGSTCLKDFTGHANPEALAKWAQYILDLYDEAREVEYDPFSYSGGSDYMNLENFLYHVAAAVRLCGWTSRGAVYRGEEQGPATADIALSSFYASKHSPAKLEVIGADRLLVTKVVEWVREDVANREDRNDYFWNLATSFSGEYITTKQSGIVASAIIAYKKEIERKAEEANTKPFEWVGTIKKRQEFDNLTLVFSTSFDSMYGPVYLYKFQDQDGNVLVWKTGSFFDWYDGETVVSGKATVKAHDEYRGTKQTVVTRAKFEAVED